MTEPIYHLAEPGAWAGSIDAYAPTSLEEEGFIHCSTASQLSGVARELFADHNDLILLTIDPDALDDGTIVFEDLYGHGEEFPHVYAPLHTSAITATGPYLAHLEEGLWSDRRSDREWVERILHPRFDSVGMRDDGGVLSLYDYRIDLIDEDVALVRYVTKPENGASTSSDRTSVWINTNEGWRLRFHQGTPLKTSG